MSALSGASFLSAISPPQTAGGPAPSTGPASSLTSALNTTLGQQFRPVPAPQQIFSQKQADALNAAIGSAVEALNAGNFASAAEHAQTLLRQDSANPIAYHLMGRIASEKGDLDLAIDHFERAASLAPDNDRFANDAFNARQLRSGEQHALATGAALVRRPDQAEDGLRLLYELGRRSERNGEIFLHIAKGLETLELPTSQLKTFEAVLEEGTRDDLTVLEGELKRFIADHVPVGLAHSILGRTQFRLGKIQDAIQSLEQARAIAPETQRYTTELAEVHASAGSGALARGDLSTARHRFTLAHELDLTNAEFTVGLAAVHVSVAKRSLDNSLENNARINLNRAATILRDDSGLDTEMGQAYYRLGKRSLAEGHTTVALDDLQKAYDRSPDLVGLGRVLADTHRTAADLVISEDEDGDLNTEQYARIVEHHRKAFDISPLRSSFRTDLAAALNDYGLKLLNDNHDYDNALAAFKEASELDSGNPAYLANWQDAHAQKEAA